MSGNPVHEGHIAVAQAAKDALGLDEVWLMITPYNTLEDKDYAAFHHRFTMARMIAKESGHLGDWLWVSDFEYNLSPPSGIPQTIDMLRAFAHAYPDWQPVWLMGGDCLTNLHLWFAWQEILQNFPVAIFSRDAANIEQSQLDVQSAIKASLCAPKNFTAQAGSCCLFDNAVSPLRSRDIRTNLLNQQTVEGIPQSVADYIRTHRLYGT